MSYSKYTPNVRFSQDPIDFFKVEFSKHVLTPERQKRIAECCTHGYVVHDPNHRHPIIVPIRCNLVGICDHCTMVEAKKIVEQLLPFIGELYVVRVTDSDADKLSRRLGKSKFLRFPVNGDESIFFNTVRIGEPVLSLKYEVIENFLRAKPHGRRRSGSLGSAEKEAGKITVQAPGVEIPQAGASARRSLYKEARQHLDMHSYDFEQGVPEIERYLYDEYVQVCEAAHRQGLRTRNTRFFKFRISLVNSESLTKTYSTQQPSYEDDFSLDYENFPLY